MSTVLVEFFKHNLWANLRLLDACSTLGDEHLSASVPGTYGSVGNTLVHIFGAEGRYVSRITRGEVVRPTPESAGFPGIEELRSRAQASGNALIEIAGSDQASQMVRFTYEGEQVELPASLLLVQAINHATEHRAQIMTTLTQHGVEPPDLSGWAWNDDVKG